MGDLTLSVDLGGTQMRAAIVARDGRILERRAQPTPQHASCPDALVDLAGDVLEGDDVTGAVIGVPGRVDYHHGRLEHAPNLPAHWPSALDETDLQAQLGVPVALANDADLAAVGEAYHGAARDHADVVYLTVSTGIGAGVLLDRRLVAGRRSLAEAGHTVIDLTRLRADAPATLEELGSGTALEEAAAGTGLEPDGAAIVAALHDGDAEAARLWDDLVAAVTVGVVNLAWLFTPGIVVLGGGVGLNGDLLIGPIRDRLADHGPIALPDPIAVVTAELEDDAGLVGGAAWPRATGREEFR